MPERLKKLRRLLSKRELDAVLISQATNRRYLSGFTGAAGFLLISPEEALLATDFRYVKQAEAEAPSFKVIQIKGEISKWFPGLISELRFKHIGFEGRDLAFTSYQQLTKAVRKLPPKSRPRLIPAQGLVESLRAVKEEEELKLIEEAAMLADAAMEQANVSLKPGVREKEVAWLLEKFLRETGSERLPFEIIVASGPNSALPHAQPTARQILEGEPVIIDLGARTQGYCSDMTRTFFPGKPDKTFKEIYQVVQEAQIAALEKIQEGLTGEEADRLARTIIERAGYGQEFGHGLGHGVGLEAHEAPRLGRESKDVLGEGMVFTLEPGIYLDGRGGVRAEDMVVLKKGKACKLTG